jgi:hypothetical protein
MPVHRQMMAFQESALMVPVAVQMLVANEAGKVF